MASHITLPDIYLKYPHKCQEIYGNTVPIPYVPKQEITCNHKYSIEYKLWKKVISCYFKHVITYLLQGDIFVIPTRLGRLQIKKYRYSKGFLKFIRKKGEKTIIKRVKNIHTDNQVAEIRWYKPNAYLQYKNYFKFRATHAFKKRLKEYIFKDFNNINKYTDV